MKGERNKGIESRKIPVRTSRKKDDQSQNQSRRAKETETERGQKSNHDMILDMNLAMNAVILKMMTGTERREEASTIEAEAGTIRVTVDNDFIQLD